MTTSLFRSIRFNVILFLCIAFLAALGTLIPQLADNADKVGAFVTNHPTLGALFNTWGLFDVYHTALFAALLTLMAFDVVVCKLANRPPDPGLVRMPADQADDDDVTLQALQSKPLRMDGRTDEVVEAAAKRLANHLRAGRFAVKRTPLAGGGVALVASRHRLQRWGSYVSHIAIVVILLGAVMKSLLGFETMLPVLEGRTISLWERLAPNLEENTRPKTGRWTDAFWAIMDVPRNVRSRIQHYSLDPLQHWTLAVDKMTVDFYPNSTVPSTFASDVRLDDDERPLARTTIRVNQPLDVHHVRFYQASWGVTGMLRQVKMRVDDKLVTLHMKQSFPVPDHPEWTARVEHYLPDFTIGDDGQPSTASLEWKNPAVVIGFYNKKQVQIGTLAVGVQSPVTPKDAPPWAMFFFGNHHEPLSRSPFDIVEADPALFSGIQVSYDPGFPVIVTGVLSMLLGLSALFYLHQRRILVFIRPHGSGSRIDVGGWSSRGEKAFGPELRALLMPWKLHSSEAASA